MLLHPPQPLMSTKNRNRGNAIGTHECEGDQLLYDFLIHQRRWFGGSALYQPWGCSSKLSEDGEGAERLGGSIEAENESTRNVN